jgi:hypothetical protein
MKHLKLLAALILFLSACGTPAIKHRILSIGQYLRASVHGFVKRGLNKSAILSNQWRLVPIVTIIQELCSTDGASVLHFYKAVGGRQAL